MDKRSETDSSRPRSRLEDEVLEILTRVDGPPSNVVKFKTRVRRGRHGLVDRLRQQVGRVRITGLTLLIATMALAILAAIVDGSSPLLGRLLALASIATLIWLFVRGFRGPDRSSSKTWRGRDIDFSPSSRPDWFSRRFGGPKRPRR